MAKRIYINNDWRFLEKFSEEMLKKDFDDSEMKKIRIPHTVKETPFNYFDEAVYQMVSDYRKEFVLSKEVVEGKQVFLTFEGAAHKADVYLNGEKIGSHACGYTAFTMNITNNLQINEKNILTVKLDSRENLNVPPFGHVVDYMTYGGIYRDVYLTVKNEIYIKDIFVKTAIPDNFSFDEEQMKKNSTKAVLTSKVMVSEKRDDLYIRHSLVRYFPEEYKVPEKEAYEREVVLGESKVSGENLVLEYETEPVCVWDVKRPALYLLKASLIQNGEVIEEETVKFGFRKALFKKEGFFLNGRKFLIRGLNRHQSYPYVGYAMPESMQRFDAKILKYELGLNAVRTSHYPQSKYFIDQCDESGLLVFMEFPGWQHIGNEEWKKQALQNLKEMIEQYRNQTSIIIWGVRINESVDDDEFYKETNRIAHELDDSRPTGGVRAMKNSNLFEDVYTYNDFVHDGVTPGCEAKKKVTSDPQKPYLITEYNGHMFPTKNYDCEEHRMQHAIRHATVLNSVAKAEEISGSFGWCMFDYNTHKDFGSGDRICYHGVMDMFRNPKMAALIYESQSEDQDVLEISSSMDIGEHPGCNRGDTWIFTNADSVKMYKNEVFIKEFYAKDSPYENIAHGPILIDDYIGDQIKKNEKFRAAQADAIKKALNAAAIKGLSNLPVSIKLIAIKMMVVYHMKPNDAVELYNKYIGDWGGTVTEYKFEAIRNGNVVKTVYKKPAEHVKLEIRAEHTELTERSTYDVSEVRIRAVDENGNVLNYYEEPIELHTEGPIEIIGPKLISFRGGMTGTYIRTTGEAGTAELSICVNGNEMGKVSFEIRNQKEKEEV